MEERMSVDLLRRELVTDLRHEAAVLRAGLREVRRLLLEGPASERANQLLAVVESALRGERMSTIRKDPRDPEEEDWSETEDEITLLRASLADAKVEYKRLLNQFCVIENALAVENAMLRRDGRALLSEAMAGRFEDLIDALRFYADAGNYLSFPRDLDNPSVIDLDVGVRAQPVLAKYEAPEREEGE